MATRGSAGLGRFWRIAAIRTNKDRLYGGELDAEQQARLREVVLTVDDAVERREHYHPFGHKEASRYTDDRTSERLGYRDETGHAKATSTASLTAKQHIDPRPEGRRPN